MGWSKYLRKETDQMKGEVKPTGANSSTALEPTVLHSTYLIPCTTKKLYTHTPAINPSSSHSGHRESKHCTDKHQRVYR